MSNNNKYSKHQNFLKKVMLELQQMYPEMRIFQQHVGLFYTRGYNPVKIGVRGMADLFGLYKTDCGLIYVQIEIKTGNAVQNKDQKSWQKFIESMNGIYIVVSDRKEIKEQIKIIGGKIWEQSSNTFTKK